MRDNISRSSIFREGMRIAAKKKKEEQEKNIKNAASTNKKEKDIGREPGE